MANMNPMALGALAVTFVGLVVVTVALSTDYWAEYGSVSQGLWKECAHCDLPGCGCFDYNLDTLPDWFKAVQAAVCLAFIANLAATVTSALFAFITSISQKLTKTCTIIFLGLAVFWNIIAVAVFAAEYSNMAWSWGMAIFAAILEVIALIVTVIAQRTD